MRKTKIWVRNFTIALLFTITFAQIILGIFFFQYSPFFYWINTIITTLFSISLVFNSKPIKL